MPEALRPPLEKYSAAMPKMLEGLESYAEKLKSRGAVKDVDGSIQEVGAAFTTDPTVESVAFEKFMVCAIPDLDKKKDIQGVLEFLAETCKKDPVAFMTKVRADCGNLVQGVDKDAKPAPSKTFKANVKKFWEEQQRQLQAWEWCGKKSRKGKKVLDLEAFLTAASDYIEARGEVVKTAREEAARLTGQPLPQEKKKPGEAGGAGPRRRSPRRSSERRGPRSRRRRAVAQPLRGARVERIQPIVRHPPPLHPPPPPSAITDPERPLSIWRRRGFTSSAREPVAQARGRDYFGGSEGEHMRIAQISPLHESVPPKLYGGTERVVHFLTEALVDLGHEVTLFASGDSTTRAELVPCVADRVAAERAARIRSRPTSR